MAKQYPNIGSWYQDAEQDLLFEVVAVDDHSGTIEIQLIGGEVDEMDFEAWYQTVLLPAEAPEDWRASYELDSADIHSIDDVIIPENTQSPLSALEPDVSVGFDEL